MTAVWAIPAPCFCNQFLYLVMPLQVVSHGLFSLLLQQLSRTQLHCLAVTFTSTHPGPAATVGGQSAINMARGAISIQPGLQDKSTADSFCAVLNSSASILSASSFCYSGSVSTGHLYHLGIHRRCSYWRCPVPLCSLMSSRLQSSIKSTLNVTEHYTYALWTHDGSVVINEYIFEWSFPSVEAMYPRQLGSLGNLKLFFFAPKPDPLKALPSTVGFFHVGSTSDSSCS